MEKENQDKSSTGKGLSVALGTLTSKLFEPSAELVGAELKHYLEDKLDSWKQKRRVENIEFHIQESQKQAMESGDIQPSLSSIRQFDLFVDWTEGAQDVGPEDRELSILWQKILNDIACGELQNKESLTILKSLTPIEASQLIKLKKKDRWFVRDWQELYYLERLEKKGLVDIGKTFSVSVWLAFFFINFGYIFLDWPVYSDALELFFSNVANFFRSEQHFFKLFHLLGLSSIFVATLTLKFKILHVWSLSSIGYRLVKNTNKN